MNERISYPERGALKLKDAAGFLSVHPITIRRLIDRGVLKPVRITRHLLIPVSQLQALLK